MDWRIFACWLLLQAVTNQGAAAQLRPAIESPADAQTRTVLVTVHPEIKDEKPKHYVGFGAKRSGELLLFPLRHPVAFANKGSFPLRHPLVAFKRFGELAEPYQPALNAVSSVSGPVTSVGVYSIGRLGH